MTITKRAATRPDLPFHDVLDYLIRKWRGPSTEYCAYEILTAIGQLSLRELQAQLLKLAYEQVVEHLWTIEGKTSSLNLSDNELPRVLAQNSYRHPATGELVANAALKLCLSYKPGPVLNQLLMFAEEPAMVAAPSAA